MIVHTVRVATFLLAAALVVAALVWWLTVPEGKTPLSILDDACNDDTEYFDVTVRWFSFHPSYPSPTIED